MPKTKVAKMIRRKYLLSSFFSGSSLNMMNDIEGCRTWVSDKTLIRLANALETEIFRLLLPNSTSDTDVPAVLALEIARELQTIKKNFDIQFEGALKSKGLC
jgi:hypothetical protein